MRTAIATLVFLFAFNFNPVMAQEANADISPVTSLRECFQEMEGRFNGTFNSISLMHLQEACLLAIDCGQAEYQDPERSEHWLQVSEQLEVIMLWRVGTASGADRYRAIVRASTRLHLLGEEELVQMLFELEEHCLEGVRSLEPRKDFKPGAD